MPDWVDIAFRFGLPTALLAAGAYGVWCGVRWFAAKVAEPLTQAHIQLIQSVQQGQEDIRETQAKQADAQQQQARTLDRLADAVDNTAESLRKLTDTCPGGKLVPPPPRAQ